MKRIHENTSSLGLKFEKNQEIMKSDHDNRICKKFYKKNNDNGSKMTGQFKSFKRSSNKLGKFNEKKEERKRKKKFVNKMIKIRKNLKREKKFKDFKKTMKQQFNGDINKSSALKNKKEKENVEMDVEMKGIMADENLSKSKKRKLIKELKIKGKTDNYDYYKCLKIQLNDLLQTRDKQEKQIHVERMYEQMRKMDLTKFARSNLGYHLLSALIINGSSEIVTKLWETFYPQMNDICIFNFVSLLFQCFYKHSEEPIKEELQQWLTQNPRSFFSKFGSRVWNVVYKLVKMNQRIKLINALLITDGSTKKMNDVSNTLLKDTPETLFNNLDEDNKKKMKTHLINMIENCVEKELLYNQVAHHLIVLACEILNEEEKTKLMDTIHEGCEYLISSNIGNKALMDLLGVSSSKHKKILLKVLKNDIIELCKSSVNFLLIIRLLKITDDTKLLKDVIVKKVVSSFKELFENYYGFYVILEFFYDFSEFERDKFLYLGWKNMVYASASSSKKDASKRKLEILPPIIEELQKLLEQKDLLYTYLKEYKYVFVIFEFLIHTKNAQVMNHLSELLQKLITKKKVANDLTKNTSEKIKIKNMESKENKKRKNEMYTSKEKQEHTLEESVVVENIGNILYKLFTYTQANEIVLTEIEQGTFYEEVCAILISNIELIVQTKLLPMCNAVISFLKENNITLYELVVLKLKTMLTKNICELLKKKDKNVGSIDKFIELVQIQIQ